MYTLGNQFGQPGIFGRFVWSCIHPVPLPCMLQPFAAFPALILSCNHFSTFETHNNRPMVSHEVNSLYNDRFFSYLQDNLYAWHFWEAFFELDIIKMSALWNSDSYRDKSGT